MWGYFQLETEISPKSEKKKKSITLIKFVPAFFVYFSPAGLEAYVFKTSFNRTNRWVDISHGVESLVSFVQIYTSFKTSLRVGGSIHSNSARNVDALNRKINPGIRKQR
jgi:hypothetical protein